MPEEFVAAPDDAAAVEEGVAEASEAAALDAREMASIIESVVFAAGAPVGVKELVSILKAPGEPEPSVAEVRAAVALLLDDYAAGKRGIVLQEVGGGYQFRTAREHAAYVRQVFREKPARLGRATLETLAIVAYQQPATKADIEAVRGVDADGALSILRAKRLIKIAGRKEAIGRPLLYATTGEFLEAFGLKDLRDLPALEEIAPPVTEEDPDAGEEEDDETSEHAEIGSPEEAARAAAAEVGEEGDERSEADAAQGAGARGLSARGPREASAAPSGDEASDAASDATGAAADGD